MDLYTAVNYYLINFAILIPFIILVKGTDMRVDIYPSLFDGLSSDLKPLVDQVNNLEQFF